MSADAGFRLCGGEAVAFRSPPPPLRAPAYRLVSNETLAGRGGSVSRRDHSQAYRRRAQLSGGTNYAESRNSNASRSSGERGLGGEGLLSEKPPLPPAFPHPTSFREGARGRGLFYRKGPSLAKPRLLPPKMKVLCGGLAKCEGVLYNGLGLPQRARGTRR